MYWEGNPALDRRNTLGYSAERLIPHRFTQFAFLMSPEFTAPQSGGSSAPAVAIGVVAPARLHMGFLDLNGELGRHFGGLGLSLADLSTRLTVSATEQVTASGPDSERAVAILKRTLNAWGLKGGVHAEIESVIPPHAGLGSGTQLALALSAAVARLYGLKATTAELAAHMGRGMRSGIGIGAFEQGGFLVDAGRGEATVVPPVLCRLPFPEHWRVLLVLDEARQGLNGHDEHAAFKDRQPMSAATSGHLCRLVLMCIIPALMENDFSLFSRGITEVQEIMGDYFANSQGGRYASPLVAEVMAWLKSEGVEGLGQSSWGPTGFALIDSETRARELMTKAQAQWRSTPALRLLISLTQNHGAEIEVRQQAKVLTGTGG
jgi:beta-RFAP synthase